MAIWPQHWPTWQELRRRGTRPPLGMGRAPRILAYCASNIGLGPYFRLLRVLAEVQRQRPAASILLVTDARESKPAEALGIALARLPGFEFTDPANGRERPQHLAISNGELRRLRAAMLLDIGRTFSPDLLLADTNPHGKRDELLPLLRWNRAPGWLHLLAGHRTAQPHCPVALLMRDIPAPPGEPFKLAGLPDQVARQARFYDRLLVAGDAALFDAADVYHWPAELAARTCQVGFVIPPAALASRAQARAELTLRYRALNTEAPLLIASFGGGWQTESYAPALLDGLQQRRAEAGAPPQAILILGPAAPRELEGQLQARAKALGGVVVERFVPDLPRLLPGADLAVLQAGSTVYQLLESELPLLLLTRDFSSREQHERAARLAHLPGIRALEGSPSAAQWSEALGWALAQPRTPRATGFHYDGAARAAQEALALLPA